MAEWTREDDHARIDRLKPLAEHLRVGHDVLPEQRRYQDTWLHIALLADEWFAHQAAEGDEKQAAAQRVGAWLDTNWKYVSDDLARDLRLLVASSLPSAEPSP